MLSTLGYQFRGDIVELVTNTGVALSALLIVLLTKDSKVFPAETITKTMGDGKDWTREVKSGE